MVFGEGSGFQSTGGLGPNVSSWGVQLLVGKGFLGDTCAQAVGLNPSQGLSAGGSLSAAPRCACSLQPAPSQWAFPHFPEERQTFSQFRIPYTALSSSVPPPGLTLAKEMALIIKWHILF